MDDFEDVVIFSQQFPDARPMAMLRKAEELRHTIPAGEMAPALSFEDKHALRHRTLAGTSDLETFARVFRKTVQVQTVVPVCSADQRQTVGAEVGMRVVEAAAKVLHQRLGKALVIVEGDKLVQNRPISSLTDVCVGAGDEPQRIIVETAAHIQIALLSERLILVVGTAVRELGGCNIEYALTGPLGYHVDKA